eukprot:GDKI01019344.1.p1 GENE.GDKI01019344.1~~GDKI01019344.1.p1  ORF type:complete len:130 (+),score=34.59 GDKI01019344.1:79-468(+)
MRVYRDRCVCGCRSKCTAFSCVSECVCSCACVSYRPVCVRVPDCVSVLCWNVCTLGGNKLRDPSFHATFARADFVFFTEARILANDLFLPGCVCANCPHTHPDSACHPSLQLAVLLSVRAGLSGGLWYA